MHPRKNKSRNSDASGIKIAAYIPIPPHMRTEPAGERALLYRYHSGDGLDADELEVRTLDGGLEGLVGNALVADDGSGAFLVAGLGALNALHGFEGPLKTAGAAAAVHAFNLHELLHYKFPP